LPGDLQNIECLNIGTRWFTRESEILA